MDARLIKIDKVYLNPHTGMLNKERVNDDDIEFTSDSTVKKTVSDYISNRLKELWNSSSAMDDHDAYYRNPVVQELKKINLLINGEKLC